MHTLSIQDLAFSKYNCNFSKIESSQDSKCTGRNSYRYNGKQRGGVLTLWVGMHTRLRAAIIIIDITSYTGMSHKNSLTPEKLGWMYLLLSSMSSLWLSLNHILNILYLGICSLDSSMMCQKSQRSRNSQNSNPITKLKLQVITQQECSNPTLIMESSKMIK